MSGGQGESKEILKIGIVGSRRRCNLSDRKIVFDIVEKCVWLQSCVGKKVQLVSGGCLKGADRFAEEAAAHFGVAIEIFPVDTSVTKNRGDFTQEAYRRNFLIANESDYLFCLVSPDRTGGTESTVGYGYDLQKKVFLVDQAGESYLSTEDQETPRWRKEKSRRDSRFTASSFIEIK